MSTPKSLSDAQLSRIIDREVRRVERRAISASKRGIARFERAVTSGYPDIKVSSLIEELQTTLSGAMYYTFLLGKRRGQLQFNRQLKLADEFSASISFLERLLKISIVNRLQRQFDTSALRVLNDVTLNIESKLRDTVNDLIVNGVHPRAAIAVIRQRLDALGVSPRSDFQLETIYRTQSQLAYGAGRYQHDRDPEVQEILWGYKYVTAGDDRVRPSHEALDGVTLPKDHAFWDRFWPPNGWNCRCQVIPVYSKRRIKNPPDGIEPDTGFNFNPGLLF